MLTALKKLLTPVFGGAVVIGERLTFNHLQEKQIKKETEKLKQSGHTPETISTNFRPFFEVRCTKCADKNWEPTDEPGADNSFTG